MFGQSYESYIEKYKETAIDQMRKTGIPASITLAQACLESAYGTSTLATKAHNHFGIKCHDWTGDKFTYRDEEGASCYRSYKKDEESFQDHSDFLRYRDRYAFLFDYSPTDYKAWAYGLKQAGYATDPQYPTKLIALIEKYSLYQYDTAVETDNLPPTPAEAETSVKVEVEKGNILYKISLDREVFSTNGVSYIVADGYETYGYLAKEYNLFKRQLLKYNDLSKDGDIEPGTVIYLQPKKNQAAKHLDKHVVEEGETMYSLSQRYAVKLSSLYKLNSLEKGQEPIAGSIIILRK
ncbi:MAG: glucosaminidase domain-containing protein [Bacteroidales bacterium]|nr:glucosaminidase domain-containing protein [Bacteroidales bacterium]